MNGETIFRAFNHNQYGNHNLCFICCKRTKMYRIGRLNFCLKHFRKYKRINGDMNE